MEREFQQIVAGTMRKEDLVHKTINQYREIYMDMTTRATVLAQTCKKYFTQT
jgi:hypothetical protein